MKEKFYRFMQGRYGTDSLNKALLTLAMAGLILSLFGLRIFYWISIALLIYAYYRMFSRNIGQRVKENQWYYYKTIKIRGFFRRKRNALRNAKFTIFINALPVSRKSGFLRAGEK